MLIDKSILVRFPPETRSNMSHHRQVSIRNSIYFFHIVTNTFWFSHIDLFGSVLISTAFLMSITRLTSGEAVRSVLSSELEAGPGLCDSVEAGLAGWEVRVGGLLAQRLGLGARDWAEQEAWAETRLDRYYTVN